MLPTRFLRSESLTGLNGHEVGHLLYTDFTSLGLYLTSMENHSFYPEPPSVAEPAYQRNQEEIMDAMEEKEKAVALTLSKCASTISNILEDIYIEARMCHFYPGTFKQGIQLNSLRMMEQAISIQEQIDQEYKEFAIIVNLILQYCRTGTVNNLSGYTGPYLDCLEDCIPYIEESIYSDEIKDRLHATNHLLVLLWEYIKPLIEETKENMKKADEATAGEELDKLLGNQIAGSTPLPPLPPENIQECMNEAQEVIAEEGSRMALTKTSTILDGSNPGITYDYQYSGSGYEKSAADLFRILNSVAKEKAEVEYQEELSEELQKTADDIHYGNAHEGIHVYVHRMSCVPDSMIKDYQKIAPPLLKASKRLQSTVAPLLKLELKGGDVHENLYFNQL